MSAYQLTPARLDAFTRHLQAEERSPGTVEKYRRDAGAFARWLDGSPVSQEKTAAWKAHLLAAHYAPVTINSMLAALNSLFRFLGWQHLRVRFLKVQRQLFRDAGRELDRAEYARLVAAARGQGKHRLALVMETICATGIRVSETAYITVEAARQGRAEIALKGKIRTILLPNKLCRKLLGYAKAQNIPTGNIFLTKHGRALTRRQIWAEMKALCRQAGVKASKVFPHNLRHLFATTFYQVSRNLVQLADVLGHASIETTRLYLVTSGAEHARQLERLKLIE